MVLHKPSGENIGTSVAMKAKMMERMRQKGGVMPVQRDLTGQRFGKLTVLERTNEKQDRYYLWRCRCDCGGEILVNTKRLRRGTVTNCGCVPKTTARRGMIAED